MTDQRTLEPILELKDIAFAYGEKSIFKGLDLQVMAGTVIGITGLSGSGKSTLIRLINGAMVREGRHDYKGQILVQGQDTKKVDHLNQHIGTLYQDIDNQLIFTNVTDEMVFGMENHGYDRPTMEDKLAQVSAQLGIEHLLDKNPNNLSGGEKQLVVLGALLCLDVSILILDESMAGIDRSTRDKVLKVIQALKVAHKTVIMIEHNKENLVSCDDLYQVRDQKLHREES